MVVEAVAVPSYPHDGTPPHHLMCSFLSVCASFCLHMLAVALRQKPWRSSSSLGTPNHTQVRPSSLPNVRSPAYQLQRDDVQDRIRLNGVLR